MSGAKTPSTTPGALSDSGPREADTGSFVVSLTTAGPDPYIQPTVYDLIGTVLASQTLADSVLPINPGVVSVNFNVPLAANTNYFITVGPAGLFTSAGWSWTKSLVGTGVGGSFVNFNNTGVAQTDLYEMSVTGTISSGVPELSTWAMLCLGFAGLGAAGMARLPASWKRA